MKSYFYISILLICSLHANSQIIQSDCTAHDSIVNQYRGDAETLTLDRIFEHNYVYVDSIIIPTAYSDTVLNALLAIYNLNGVPERDTVVDILNIHARALYSLNDFYFKADSNLAWMQNLSNGNLNTGQPILDDIITTYNFSMVYYNPSSWQPSATALFTTAENYNLRPIADTIETIVGVNYADPDMSMGDGPTIFDTIYPTHVELTYRYAWGDCPAGCLAQRLWKFNVYYDCTVEFMGSSGISLPPTASLVDNDLPSINIYPNPFTDFIKIEGITDEYSYSIYDLSGKIIRSGKENGDTIELQSLPKGSYIIALETNEGVTRMKITK
jgi:Secretion system C-terminal sorting domain